MFGTAKALQQAQSDLSKMFMLIGERTGELRATTSENAQLRATIEWMKLRLNAVEKERAQLISAAIGVKVSIPEFVPITEGTDIQKALQEMPDLSSVGGDAPDDVPETDYSQWPGYRAQK